MSNALLSNKLLCYENELLFAMFFIQLVYHSFVRIAAFIAASVSFTTNHGTKLAGPIIQKQLHVGTSVQRTPAFSLGRALSARLPGN